MDYKEWFDKLCETHERKMKQAERGMRHHKGRSEIV